MEKTENKYSRGKIYKIISNQTNEVYYGSTIEKYITNRLSGHKRNYRMWLKGKGRYTTSFELVKYDDCKIILVESYPCNTIYDLTSKEQYYLDNNNCINKNKAPTGLCRSEYNKQRYDTNRDELIKQSQQYYVNNREMRLKCRKDHYQKHKDENKAYNKQYYDANIEKMKNYYECNKESILQKCKKYRETNKEKIDKK